MYPYDINNDLRFSMLNHMMKHIENYFVRNYEIQSQ